MTHLTAEIKARIKPEQRNRFRAKAKALGLKESELLRAVIQEIIEDEQEQIKPLPDVNNTQTVRITIRMPRFILESAKERATAKGMVISRWITALVQSNLTSQPVMADQELAALQTSNRELAAIGRNLNQIARAINEAFYQTERVKLEKLTALNEVINENREVIRTLVRASQNVWRAE